MKGRWITIYKYFDILEGQRLEGFLEAENIPFRNISRHDSAFDGVFTATIGAGIIQVREDYVQAAQKIVADFEKEQRKIAKAAKIESSSFKSMLINIKAVFRNRYLSIGVVFVLVVCFLAIGTTAGRVYYFRYHPDLDKARYCSDQGKVLFEQKNYKQALKLLNRSVMFDPNFARSYSRLGYVYFHLKQYKQAVKYYKIAVNLDPGDYRDYGGLGNAYIGLGYYHNAITALQKAIELNPKAEFAYIYLGRAHQAIKNWELAIANFKKALELNPNSAVAYEGLSEINYFLKDYDKLLEYAKKAIEINPNGAAGGYFYAGFVYFNQNLNKQALPYFEKAAAIYPGYLDIPQNFVVI